jgi:serine/threonine protein kinase
MDGAMRELGSYELVREIGRGGMAIVYLARQRELGRLVAIKELLATDTSLARRFVRESRLAGSLAHPNIVSVIEYFERDGMRYIAMEYVPSGSLRPRIAGLSTAQITGVLEGVLAGLSHAHWHGVVHRDLKPENLMVTADGHVKIADFGVAKPLPGLRSTTTLTGAGMAIGTPGYMAPEQALGEPVGPWSDLYAVGCIAYELVTGGRPFRGADSAMRVLLRHINERVPPAATVAASVDWRLSDWIERLLAKEPAQRPKSAELAWQELEEIVLAIEGPCWRRSARLQPLGTPPPADRPVPAARLPSAFHAIPPPPAS